MADYPPFMNATGTLPKVLGKIKEAQTPERFTQDYLSTKLGFPGGTAKAFIQVAKRLGLLASDGTPTDLYRSFRNPSESGSAMARAIRQGYSDLYARNEYAHALEKKKLEGLVVEMTGLAQGHSTVRAIVGTFEALKTFADFEKKQPPVQQAVEDQEAQPPREVERGGRPVPLGLSYTINLVLPKTDDVAVFNAIFKSLREHILDQ